MHARKESVRMLVRSGAVGTPSKGAGAMMSMYRRWMSRPGTHGVVAVDGSSAESVESKEWMDPPEIALLIGPAALLLLTID